MSDSTGTRSSGSGAQATRLTGAGPERSTADMHSGEGARILDISAELAVQLSEQLKAVRDRLVAAFDGLEVLGFRGELTVIARPGQLLDLLTFCRDDPDLRCALLADLSAVHWPGGRRVESSEETTGWPNYEFDQEQGRMQLDYILYSVDHHHRFRVRVDLPDVEPTIASATAVYSSANWMEREVFDFFGVAFTGHPNLKRSHMPDDWDGHPLRKDYPLGGVDVQYKGAQVPPPDERHY